MVKRIPRPDEAPTFVERRPNVPEPYVQARAFHGTPYNGWSGHVQFEHIGAWIQNPRTEYLKIKFFRDTGGDPDSDQMCQMMVEDDDLETGMGIKELADNIAANGLRQPLILTKTGDLLDGNRRYAALWWLRKTRQQIPDDAKHVPVWVLDAEMSDSHAASDIITDLNFVGDYKKEWSQYVRARVLYEQWDKGKRNGIGLSVPQLAQRYGWSQSRVRSTVTTAALIEEFLEHYESSVVALEVAFSHFIWFEQLRRSNGKLLDDDYEFKVAIFKWLLPPEGEEGRFQQARDFIRLTEIRNKPEAWETLEAKSGPAGLREAIWIVEGDRLNRGKDPTARMQRVVKDIKEMKDKGELDKLGGETLDAFHGASAAVPGAPPDADARIRKMVDWLNTMSVGELRKLAPDALTSLRNALNAVIRMAETVSAENVAEKD